MLELTIGEAAIACGGLLCANRDVLFKRIGSITIDSRKVLPDSLFIALHGEHIDGHRFIPAAMNSGAACVMSEVSVSYPHIRVRNTRIAMQKLAAYMRVKSGIPVLAVVGSVGKTSTRRMLSCVLGEKYNLLSTEGNFNNEYGLPQTLFRLEDTNDFAVLELGISNFGEMDRLGEIAKPNYALYTNIGNMHLENLGDRDGVLKAKTELIPHIAKDGMLFFNGEDDKLRSFVSPVPVTYFGMDGSYPVYPSSIEQSGLNCTNFDLHFPDAVLPVSLPALGIHMVRNAVAAATVGLHLGLTPEQIVHGIESYTPVGHRGRIIELGDFTIVDDCYNAGPDSMRASINTLPHTGRRLALLGDMLELGETSPMLHYDLGKFAAEAKLDMLFTVGNLSEKITEGAKASGLNESYHLDEKDAAKFIISKLQKGDVLLVKASRGMLFEKLIDKITEELK